MNIRIPIMIQDPTLAGYPTLKRIVERPFVSAGIFLAGPASRRWRSSDLDLQTGQVQSGVPFPFA